MTLTLTGFLRQSGIHHVTHHPDIHAFLDIYASRMALKLSPLLFVDVYHGVRLHALLHQASLGHLIGRLSLCLYTSTGGESIY